MGRRTRAHPILVEGGIELTVYVTAFGATRAPRRCRVLGDELGTVLVYDPCRCAFVEGAIATVEQLRVRAIAQSAFIQKLTSSSHRIKEKRPWPQI